jgi:diguanylate cyclase (GGDEF)-like protein
MGMQRVRILSNLFIPALVLLLGLCAVISITNLQAESRESQKTQLSLERMETTLIQLQGSPFAAAPALGGSPLAARLLIASREETIDTSIARLLRADPSGPLRALPGQLQHFYSQLDQAYVTIVKVGLGPGAPALAAGLQAEELQLANQIHLADAASARRAATANRRATIGSAVVILLLVAGFGLLFRRSSRARAIAERLVVENGELLATSRVEALTDALTGLPNRRSLVLDLDAAYETDANHVLAILDLDGFKSYNDTFGHPAGDALIARLGKQLLDEMHGVGTAYRMGGDEFCVLAPAGDDHGEAVVQRAADALTVRGDAFHIGCSFGRATTRDEADTAEHALRLADQRMYGHKARRTPPSRQTTDVLVSVLSERSPLMHHHLDKVAGMAESTARTYGLPDADVEWVRIAAELHDIGKVAIPDAILNKAGPLDDKEWTFMKRHSAIGERIIAAAPALAPVARLVREHHEHYDGGGYPDGLRGGEILIGARILAVCDAYNAMITDRVYRAGRSPAEALLELRRCAGKQFDPTVVEHFCTTVEHRQDALPVAA